MPEVRRYSGVSQQEALRLLEAEKDQMAFRGLIPGNQSWSRESRRLRPDLFHLDTEWVGEPEWRGVRFHANGSLRVRVDTPEEIRSAIAELKLRKKELVIERKELVARASALRVEHRAETAKRSHLSQGKGTSGKFVHDLQKASRQASDQQAADQVAQVERQKLGLDRLSAEIDRLMLQLEGQLAK